MSIKSGMPSNHLILRHPFLLLPSIFPSIRVFSNESFFISGDKSIGVSASVSVLPMNIQDWFPLGSTGLTSLQSKQLSRVFSNTTVQKHPFFGAHLYSPTLTSIHDYWQNHSFDWMHLLREGKGYPLQYSVLENSVDGIVHGVAKSWTWLSDFCFGKVTSLLFDMLSRLVIVFLPRSKHLLIS